MVKVWFVVVALCASAAADTGGRVGGGSWKSTGSTNTNSSSTRIGHSSPSSSWSTPTTTTHDDFKWNTTPTYTPSSAPSHGYLPPAGYESDGSDSSGGSGGTYVPYVDTTDYTPKSSFFDDAFPFVFGLIALFIVGGFVKEFVLEHRPATTNFS